MDDLGDTHGTRDTADERTLTVTADTTGRLDKVLADAIPDLSRSRLKTLIENGLVSVDGQRVLEPSARVKPGQRLIVRIPAAEPAEAKPEALPLTIVYEDASLLVVDKPSGLVVHPAPGNREGTLVNALLAHCGDSLSGIGGVARPGIVHRLDKETSGLIVVAKNDAAHAGLKAQFQDRSLSRTYWAFASGAPWPRSGFIDAPIGRSARNRKKMAVVETGRPSLTLYRTITTFGDRAHPLASLIECRLKTGRTHQIRVHLASLGHPIIGDKTYGGGAKHLATRGIVMDRQALHAKVLSFVHPDTQQPMVFETEIPNDMKDLCQKLELIQ
ncbi:MAG: RluA family pseudouridine synthase [Pseudomonadota bacterium]